MRIPPIVGALVASLLSLLLLAPPPVAAQPTAAAESGRVRGEILTPGSSSPTVKVSWFTQGYGKFLGSRKARGGGYSLSLPPGTYELQFTDTRPAYDTRKFAPTDVTVRVVAGTTVGKSVRMRRGGAIGGVVKAGGKRAGGARVVAALPDERSFESTADKSGNYALAGLPAGRYSVFTYDRRKRFVGKSTFVRSVKAGKYKKVNISLRSRAGNLSVDLTGLSNETIPRVYATAVSKKTGQFWTVPSSGGQLVFRGLYPGKYRLIVPGVGIYFQQTFNLGKKVKPGRLAFESARMTDRGGWVTGSVEGENRRGVGLEGATVTLLDASGGTLASATTNASGVFVLQGRLDTDDALSLVVAPGPNSAYLGPQGQYRCAYERTEGPGTGLTRGQQTDVGPVVIDLLDNGAGQGPSCQPPASGAAGR